MGEQHWEEAGREERKRPSWDEWTHSLQLLVGRLGEKGGPKAPHTRVGQCVYCVAAK